MSTRGANVIEDGGSNAASNRDEAAWDAARPFSALVAALPTPRGPPQRKRRPRRVGAAPAFRAGALGRIHAAGATSLFTHKVLPLLSAADLGRFAATAPAATRADRALNGRGLCDYVAWRRLAEPRRRAAVAPGAALRLLHADTERCTLVVLKRRGTRLADAPQAAPVDLAAVRGAATVARRAATLAVGSRFVEPRRTELHALATEADAARAGVVVTDGVFIGAFAAAAAAAGDAHGFDLAPRDAARLRLASRAFDAEIARGEAVVRNVIPALARSPLRADGCWVLRAVDGRACWTPEAYAERVAVAAAAGAATVRVDLERAYDRRDIVLPLSTEARLAVCLCVQVTLHAVEQTQPRGNDRISAQVILARQAFELDARADAALFATAPALRRRAVCLTERDRATLEDHGARARATVPVILVALDA